LLVPLANHVKGPTIRLLCTEIENIASFNGSTFLALPHFKTVIIRGQIRSLPVGFVVHKVAKEHVLGFPLPVSFDQYKREGNPIRGLDRP
jgi:hypothetical protein